MVGLLGELREAQAFVDQPPPDADAARAGLDVEQPRLGERERAAEEVLAQNADQARIKAIEASKGLGALIESVGGHRECVWLSTTTI